MKIEIEFEQIPSEITKAIASNVVTEIISICLEGTEVVAEIPDVYSEEYGDYRTTIDLEEILSGWIQVIADTGRHPDQQLYANELKQVLDSAIEKLRPFLAKV
jgi:hypothetical protein